MLAWLFRFLAPHDCLLCGREGSLLCAWCWPEVHFPIPSRCYRCHKLTIDYAVCVNCRKQTVLRHMWVSTVYRGVVRKLVHNFKFERAKDTAELLAMILGETCPYLAEDTVITYIPTASSRVRLRGYDHARELADAFGRQSGRQVTPLLYRIGQARQVGAPRQKRLIQMQTAFRPRNRERTKDANILLIDDIVTTGGTLDAAARILKAAGAKSVNALVVAQK